LGGLLPRRIHYYPETGRVIRRLLGSGESKAVAREETEYVSRLSTRTMAGEIQLFDE
jgi:chemotaxis protein CheD